jgi:hypothetical protein
MASQPPKTPTPAGFSDPVDIRLGHIRFIIAGLFPVE